MVVVEVVRDHVLADQTEAWVVGADRYVSGPVNPAHEGLSALPSDVNRTRITEPAPRPRCDGPHLGLRSARRPYETTDDQEHP